MTKNERAHLIVSHVLALDHSHRQVGPPRSGASKIPTRCISNDPRWEARVSPKYEKGDDGELWDLFELFVYGQQRMTAAVKGSELRLRYYLPGIWEPIFVIIQPRDTTPLLPSAA